MDQNLCNALRDLLFAQKFQYPGKGYTENQFRFVAVLPDHSGACDALVHFAYDSPVWVRAGVPSDVIDVVDHIRIFILGTEYSEHQIGIVNHRHLRDGWPLPWEVTARADHHNFPTIVAVERADGSVAGAVMRDPHVSNSEFRIADGYAEPAEASALIERLRSADQYTLVEGLYKDSDIDAPSILEAVSTAPKTVHGQAMVILYREDEWLKGLWNDPEMGLETPMTLTKVSTHLPCRVSESKRAERPALDVARDGQVMAGDYQVLMSLASQLQPASCRPEALFELNPCVIELCDWWNQRAPEGHRSAGFFSLYLWKGKNKVFVPCHGGGEPPMTAEQIVNVPCYSLFEQPGHPTLAAVFYRGKEFNEPCPIGTQVFFADGQLAFEIGLDPDEVDEAYNSVTGLEVLRQSLLARKSA